jgi:hypothetical protein
MATVMMRGALMRESVNDVALESILALIVFMVIGAIAGWIADYLIRDAVETAFRKRVEWFRKGLEDAGYLEGEANKKR